MTPPAVLNGDTLVPTHCSGCGMQCGLYLRVGRRGRVSGVEPRDHDINRMRLCPRGITAYQQVDHADRLTVPLVRRSRDEPFRAVSWEAALDVTAAEIRRIQEAHGRDAFGLLGGAGLGTEKTYLLGKFARVALRTRHVDDNAGPYGTGASDAHRATFGIDRPANPFSDMLLSDCLLVAGPDVGERFPVLTRYLWGARDRGARLIVIDPRASAIARTADIHVALRPGTDPVFCKAVLHVMTTEGLTDQDFLTEHTTGWAEVERASAAYPPERAATVCGVPAEQVVQVARHFGTARNAMAWYAGTDAPWPPQDTESSTRSETESCVSVINLCLATGNIGRPGAGYGALTDPGAVPVPEPVSPEPVPEPALEPVLESGHAQGDAQGHAQGDAQGHAQGDAQGHAQGDAQRHVQGHAEAYGHCRGGREPGWRADMLPGGRSLAEPAHRRELAHIWDVEETSLPGPAPTTGTAEQIRRGAIRGLLGVGDMSPASFPGHALPGHALHGYADAGCVDAAHADAGYEHGLGNGGTSEPVPPNSLEFHVQCASFLSGPAVGAHVVLPVTTWAEDDAVMTNAEGRMVKHNKAQQPPPDVRTETWVLCQLAVRLGVGNRFAFAGSREVFHEWRTASAGTAVDCSGVSHERLEETGGIAWPCPAVGHPGTPRLFEDGRSHHADGRFHLHVGRPAGERGRHADPRIASPAPGTAGTG